MDTYFIFAIILLLGELLLFFLIRRQNRFMGRMFGHSEARDIIELLNHSVQKSEYVEEKLAALLAVSRATADVAGRSTHKIGFVRYNAFPSMGGEQSFSIALLDAANSGFVLTGLHGKETTRVYSKLMRDGVSQYNLSREEKEAIARAIGEGKT